MMSVPITLEHPLWPTQLDQLVNPPQQLWVAGDATLLLSPMIAIVGSRACTAYGSQVAADIAEGMAGRFIVVTDGAFGIDTAALRGALQSQHKTVVVLAGGLERLYPEANRELFERIVDRGGLLVSELAPAVRPDRFSFLQRNRLIAALSAGTVVVEAGRRSGTTNMAGWCKLLRRPLMAVPGPVTSAVSAGCHDMIRDGAHLVTEAADVRQVMDEAAYDALGVLVGNRREQP